MAKLAVATVSSCAHLPWMTDVWFLRAWLSTAFHTCGCAWLDQDAATGGAATCAARSPHLCCKTSAAAAMQIDALAAERDPM